MDLTPQDKANLLKLARLSIAKEWDKSSKEKIETLLKELEGKKNLQTKTGVFVTIEIDEQLKGCIGNIISEESIIKGIKENAVNAAFYDPRFLPLKEKELSKTSISISILTQPVLLKYSSSYDLISKLKKNIDGVIIKRGSRSATFLPQVWEDIPSKESFLSHLCVKAGLEVDAWEKDDSQFEVYTYQVKYLSEK